MKVWIIQATQTCDFYVQQESDTPYKQCIKNTQKRSLYTVFYIIFTSSSRALVPNFKESVIKHSCRLMKSHFLGKAHL